MLNTYELPLSSRRNWELKHSASLNVEPCSKPGMETQALVFLYFPLSKFSSWFPAQIPKQTLQYQPSLSLSTGILKISLGTAVKENGNYRKEKWKQDVKTTSSDVTEVSQSLFAMSWARNLKLFHCCITSVSREWRSFSSSTDTHRGETSLQSIRKHVTSTKRQRNILNHQSI